MCGIAGFVGPWPDTLLSAMFASLVGASRGDHFFGAWSKIVREHEGEAGFKRSIDVSTEVVKRA